MHSLPEKARILHIADDYGQLDFLLLLTYPEREIVSVITDDEKRAIAQHSYLTKIRKIRYVKSIDDEQWTMDNFDFTINNLYLCPIRN